MAHPDTTAATPETPRVVIQPRKGWLPVNWGELWERRELLYFLTWRDIKVRYKQTVLGALWAILQPFLTMVVLSVVFKSLLGLDRRLMGAGAQEPPYAVFLFAGLLPWQFFGEAVKRCNDSVITSAPLTQKVYFPRLVIPMASAGAALVDFALSYLILIGLMIYYGLAPGLAILAVVPLAAATALAAVGVGAFVSALNVAYRDFRYVVPFVLQIWFYTTPLIWALRKVPPAWRPLVALNPMCGIVEAYRWAILPGWDLDVAALAISLAVSLWLFLVGLRFFRRLERQFADIL